MSPLIIRTRTKVPGRFEYRIVPRYQQRMSISDVMIALRRSRIFTDVESAYNVAAWIDQEQGGYGVIEPIREFALTFRQLRGRVGRARALLHSLEGLYSPMMVRTVPESEGCGKHEYRIAISPYLDLESIDRLLERLKRSKLFFDAREARNEADWATGGVDNIITRRNFRKMTFSQLCTAVAKAERLLLRLTD